MRMPTAQHWLHRARLQDRRSVLIRRVCRHDALSLQGFVSALDAQSRYQRFFIPLRELTAAMLERLTQPDQRIGCALIALAGREEVAGVVQYQLIEHNEAEAAVVVGQRWRRVGLASLLLSDLAIVAAANGEPLLLDPAQRHNRLQRRLGPRVLSLHNLFQSSRKTFRHREP